MADKPDPTIESGYRCGRALDRSATGIRTGPRAISRSLGEARGDLDVSSDNLAATLAKIPGASKGSPRGDAQEPKPNGSIVPSFPKACGPAAAPRLGVFAANWTIRADPSGVCQRRCCTKRATERFRLHASAAAIYQVGEAMGLLCGQPGTWQQRLTGGT